MVDKPEDDLTVNPQQLIGGINGMILRLHKFQVELEESKTKHFEQTEKIKALEAKNEECKNDVNELTKTKERLTELSGFLQKSLEKKKAENNQLLERLKQAEIQLGESGSVLATIKNLESKNELLSEKMSNVLLNTEEEIVKARAEREEYMKLFQHASELNKRNLEIQTELVKAQGTGDEHSQRAKILVEKSELFCSDISKTLDDIRRVKQQFLESNSERVRNCMKENALLQKENNDLKNNLMELETKLGEQQKENNVLKEQVAKQQDEKQTLLNEVHSMKNTMHEKLEESAVEDAKKNKQYDALQQQLEILVESYGEATQQLGRLRESVDESKVLLKANIEKEETAETEDSEDRGKINLDYFALVVEMQGIFQQCDIRDEELASLENIAGIQRQHPNDTQCKEMSGMASCIRGLVAIKDSQINNLMRERDEMIQQVAEKKKNEFRQSYQLSELEKENHEMAAKVETWQAKYHRLKEEKEDIRQSLLVKNAADKITHSYINKLKHENEQYKANVQKQQETLKQQFQALKDDLNHKMEAKNALLEATQEKIVLCQRERDALEHELNSRRHKDNTMKEQIISMFGS